MANIPYIKKKIGQSYLVWFQNSNLYFQLEEPAWFVFNKINRRYKSETIAKECAQRYSQPYEEAIRFVNEMRRNIEEINKTYRKSHSTKKEMEAFLNHEIHPFSVHKYHLDAKVIRFSFETDWLEDYIHPLIQHLETRKGKTVTSEFELFTADDWVVFRLNGEVKGTWTKDESHFTKGKIFLELINVLYEKTDLDWLMTVHASAVTNGRKTILFSAEPGSGKTTMAALLKNEGYHVISDDFVPIDINLFNAYPFPIAMSVKEGSMELLTSLYPELEKGPMYQTSPTKNVRFLPVKNEIMKMIYPVEEFIFVSFDQNEDFRMEKLDLLDAFKLLLDQIWVPPSPNNVETLFERIQQASFYQLTYSNNQRALDAINQMFEND